MDVCRRPVPAKYLVPALRATSHLGGSSCFDRRSGDPHQISTTSSCATSYATVIENTVALGSCARSPQRRLTPQQPKTVSPLGRAPDLHNLVLRHSNRKHCRPWAVHQISTTPPNALRSAAPLTQGGSKRKARACSTVQGFAALLATSPRPRRRTRARGWTRDTGAAARAGPRAAPAPAAARRGVDRRRSRP